MSRILHTLTVASSLLAAVSFSRAAAPGPSRIVLRPADGELERGDTLRISFPTAMVSTAGIDVKTASPIAFEPEIDGAFLWKSQTEGEHRVEGPVRPGTRYAVRLRRGLVDAGGAPVAAPD